MGGTAADLDSDNNRARAAMLRSTALRDHVSELGGVETFEKNATWQLRCRHTPEKREARSVHFLDQASFAAQAVEQPRRVVCTDAPLTPEQLDQRVAE